jgi:hypothetical protein
MGKKKSKGKGKGGRPRKSGERYPGGKLKPQVTQQQAENVVGSSSVSPASVHRIRELGRTFALDPKLGTELGRLLLLERVTTLEAAAGWRIGEVYGRFERQHGKRRAARSPSYELGFRAAGAAAETPDDAQAPFIALQKKLRIYGARACDAIETLCVDNEPIGPAALQMIVRPILATIGKDHFGMQAAVIPTGPQTQAPKIGRRKAEALASTSRAHLDKPRADGAEVLAELLRDVMDRREVLEVLNFARAVRDRRTYRTEKETEDAQ